MTRALAFATALLLASLSHTPAAQAADPVHFWDLQPRSLRLLVASPQVMVTRTKTGWDAYCRCPVVLAPSEIPEVMKKAIIAIEDKRYFDHSGVDVTALLSVLKGGLTRGGSTIPMQLLKNLVFHDLRASDVLTRLERKGAEVWYAGLFNEAVGKEELLAAYLNQIEFGGRDIVGLYRASRHYFRKEPKDLTLYEAALLAGMVKAPARLNPLRESTRERAHERALLVLKLMAEQDLISDKERRQAEKAGIRPGMLPEFKIQPQAFAEWVVETWGEKYVQPGETVRFFVTLNPRVQHIAEQQLSRLVKDGAVPLQYDAGAVMMAPNGRVQAMVGSVNWSQRQFNNAVKARVQAGSTAKLPLLIAACEAGRMPESRVMDQPVRGTWPANGELGYRGQTTLKEAFASSRNAAAVRLTQELGADTVATVSRRIGIDPGPAADSSFVLGSYSSNVMTMTAAYTAVANGGYRIEPSGLLAVVDGRGQVRADFLTPMRTRVIHEKCIEPTQAVLREVVQHGTGRAAQMKHWAAYGKTGTSTGNADAWFVGWSEQRVFGVWMGRRRGAAGHAVAGAGAPAAYFGRVATAVNEWAERQQRLEEQRLASARPKRGLEPGKIVDWLSSLPQAMTLPSASSAQKKPSRDKRT
ncbi:transglycosylase domain-containing protein [Microvirga arabica]|uniref:peptidoglycan glycosyltransferase n=1 Tax=Microvirga arabica TaxID=1128671 RepID=A0ABV6Y9P7_9HYPH|nr:transglycosylase domain-containing protein [Microvirga arabica]MBM1174433.1 transglycosylase domain-containing protein [Microvirga arabica]